MSMVSEVVYWKSLLLDGIYLRRHEPSKSMRRSKANLWITFPEHVYGVDLQLFCLALASAVYE